MADVNFTPKTWKDGSSGGTPITASELNRMEQGIEDCATACNDLGDSISPKLVGKVGDFASFYKGGSIGLLTIERTLSGVKEPWGTVIESSLPGGFAAAAYIGSPVSIDDKPDITLIATVDTVGTVSIKNRGSKSADFGSGSQIYGCFAFPLKQ